MQDQGPENNMDTIETMDPAPGSHVEPDNTTVNPSFHQQHSSHNEEDNQLENLEETQRHAIKRIQLLQDAGDLSSGSVIVISLLLHATSVVRLADYFSIVGTLIGAGLELITLLGVMLYFWLADKRAVTLKNTLHAMGLLNIAGPVRLLGLAGKTILIVIGIFTGTFAWMLVAAFALGGVILLAELKVNFAERRRIRRRLREPSLGFDERQRLEKENISMFKELVGNGVELVGVVVCVVSAILVAYSASLLLPGMLLLILTVLIYRTMLFLLDKYEAYYLRKQALLDTIEPVDQTDPQHVGSHDLEHEVENAFDSHTQREFESETESETQESELSAVTPESDHVVSTEAQVIRNLHITEEVRHHLSSEHDHGIVDDGDQDGDVVDEEDEPGDDGQRDKPKRPSRVERLDLVEDGDELEDDEGEGAFHEHGDLLHDEHDDEAAEEFNEDEEDEEDQDDEGENDGKDDDVGDDEDDDEPRVPKR